MKILVGATGFVGGNLLREMAFDLAVHRKDVARAYGKRPELLIYAGLPAAKFLANHEPEKDRAAVQEAEENIRRIAPRRLVVISTIDVLGAQTAGRDERTEIETEGLAPYGLHRYELEQWTRGRFPDALIVRLPALFGPGLKKNFLYDFLHPVPEFLSAKKFTELVSGEGRLMDVYAPQANGFYRRTAPVEEILPLLQAQHFSALSFTDSRSRYQFYPLARLAHDIEIALAHDIHLLHLATEPLAAGEIYTALTGRQWENEILDVPADYDFRTQYAGLWGNKGQYLLSREDVFREIQCFVGEEKHS